jgi:periplasmic protein TonB
MPPAAQETALAYAPSYRATAERPRRGAAAAPLRIGGRSPARLVGIAIVALLHVGIGYALVNGLAQRTVEAIRPPIVAKIIEAPPPPKPPAPKSPAPRLAPPPPLFVPPPEVRIAPPPAPPPRAVTAVTKAPPPVAAPPAPAPVAAPPAPPAPKSEPVRSEARLDLAQSREPEYPAASRRAREQGSVLVQVLVGLDGRPLEAKLVESSGYPRLDQAALAGIKDGYRFVPASLDGRPVQSWFTFKFTWKLR